MHEQLAWRDVLLQYVGFVSSFWILGAIGFRFGVVRGGVRDASAAVDRAVARAGALGLLGVALGFVSMAAGLAKRAAPKHQTLVEAFHAGGTQSLLQLVLLCVLVLAFALAWRSVRVAWPVAALGALALALRGAVAGRAAAMVNPLHVLGASLWIGTLFVLVVCGLGELLGKAVPASEREPAVAEIVHRFSTLALLSAALLGVTGLITAWNHLHALRALWTTPYGYALDVKLFFVAVVAALGAWNWRRVGPALGSEGGARAIRRTATTELAFAAIVLFVTAILVSLPSPKAPKPARQRPSKSAQTLGIPSSHARSFNRLASAASPRRSTRRASSRHPAAAPRSHARVSSASTRASGPDISRNSPSS